MITKSLNEDIQTGDITLNNLFYQQNLLPQALFQKILTFC